MRDSRVLTVLLKFYLSELSRVAKEVGGAGVSAGVFASRTGVSRSTAKTRLSQLVDRDLAVAFYLPHTNGMLATYYQPLEKGDGQ